MPSKNSKKKGPSRATSSKAGPSSKPTGKSTSKGPANAAAYHKVEAPLVDGTRRHLKEIGGTPLLTAEEEVLYAQQIEQEALALEAATTEVTRAAALRRYHAARNRLAEANLRYVVSIAKRYVNHGVPLDDLIEEGYLGLLRAAEKFDWRRGFRFTTYAMWWVQQQILRAIPEQTRPYHLPAHIAERLTALSRTSARLLEELGREATDAELRAALSWTQRELDDARVLALPATSLDTPAAAADDEEAATLGHTLVAQPAEEPRASQRELVAFMRAIGLVPKERMVLLLRFGLLDGKERTLEEVGRQFDVTRERVRQVEKKALKALQDHADELRAYLAADKHGVARLFAERAAPRMLTHAQTKAKQAQRSPAESVPRRAGARAKKTA